MQSQGVVQTATSEVYENLVLLAKTIRARYARVAEIVLLTKKIREVRAPFMAEARKETTVERAELKLLQAQIAKKSESFVAKADEVSKEMRERATEARKDLKDADEAILKFVTSEVIAKVAQ